MWKGARECVRGSINYGARECELRRCVYKKVNRSDPPGKELLEQDERVC